MLYLNAGNIWDNEYLDKVIEWNKEFHDTVQVKALFGSLAELTPTARAADRLPYRGWSFLEEYVNKASLAGINIRWTLNTSCIGPLQDFVRDWLARLRHDIRQLHDLGIHQWIITSPLILELLRPEFPEDFFEVSTIAEVSTPEEMKRWAELGANGVNISTSINRDFPAIKNIVKTGAEVSILSNEACLFRCPWRRECYNLSSHNSERAEALFGFYPFRRCTEVRLDSPVEWLKSRLLLPQWMKTYQDLTGVNWFKIAYRTHPIETALPMLRAYMEQDFHGNLLELWPTISHLGNTIDPKDRDNIPVELLETNNFLQHFIDHGTACSSMECKDCRYCHGVYQMITGSK